MIEKTDIRKTFTSDKVLKNPHVVVISNGKKYIKCTFESLYKMCAQGKSLFFVNKIFFSLHIWFSFYTKNCTQGKSLTTAFLCKQFSFILHMWSFEWNN